MADIKLKYLTKLSAATSKGSKLWPTILLANEPISDVLQIGGSDSVALSADNMPSHSHGFSGNTSSFDHGTKTTSTNGQHFHNVPEISQLKMEHQCNCRW